MESRVYNSKIHANAHYTAIHHLGSKFEQHFDYFRLPGRACPVKGRPMVRVSLLQQLHVIREGCPEPVGLALVSPTTHLHVRYLCHAGGNVSLLRMRKTQFQICTQGIWGKKHIKIDMYGYAYLKTVYYRCVKAYTNNISMKNSNSSRCIWTHTQS